MTAFVRPSLILHMDLDERLMGDETIADIKRSYSYVAPSIIESHTPADEEHVENVLQFDIRLRRPYWNPQDEASEELWQGVMPKWLHNMIAKVGNTITALARVDAKSGKQFLDYVWWEFSFDKNALLRIASASNSTVDDRVIEWTQQVRELEANNALGEGVACIHIPSRARYDAQRAEAEETARAAAEAAREAVEAEARVAEEAAADAVVEAAADGETEAGGEADAGGAATVDGETGADGEAATNPALELGEAATADGEAASTDGEPEADGESEEQAFRAPARVPFDIDYSIWGIEYADGSIREFDPQTASFIE